MSNKIGIDKDEKVELAVKDDKNNEGGEHKEREWSNPIEFLMTCIGS